MSDEAINVVLGAQFAALAAGMQEAAADVGGAVEEMKASFEGLSATVDTLMAPIVALGALLTGGEIFKESIEKTSELGVQLEVLSQKTGLTVEEVSRLQYAADLSHVSVEELTIGLQRLARGMEESEKGTGPANDAFHALGMSVTDASGRLVPLQDVLLQLATRFATMQDGAGKTALAMDLFGRSGADLIPFLNQGADGIQKLEAEADRLGVTMTEKGVQSAVAYEEAMKNFDAEMGAIERNITLGLLPALASIAKTLTDSMGAGSAWVSVGTAIGDAFRVIGTTAALAWTQIKIYYDTVVAIAHLDNPWPKIKQDASDAASAIKSIWSAVAEQPKPPTDNNTKAPHVTTVTPLTTLDKYREQLNQLKELTIQYGLDQDKIELKFWQDKLAITDEGSKDYLDIQTHVVDLESQIAQKGAEAQKKAAEEQKKVLDETSKQWMSAFADIPNAFDGALKQMQNSTQSFGAFFKDMVRGLVTDFAAGEAKMLEGHAAMWLAKKGITTQGVLEEVALNAWAAITSIANYAAQAAAAAWAAISAIPIIGPFAAPAAAAAALAGVLALTGVIKSAAGGYDIPAGLNPVTQLHAQEMVLPAKYADVIRGMAEGGGGGSGDTHNYYVQAMDSQDVERFFRKHASSVARATIQGGHNGVRLPTGPGRG